jgi:tetratricopeptide (TPR) repeat protein
VWEDRGHQIADHLPKWGAALFAAVFGGGKAYAAYIKAREGDAPAELVIESAAPQLLGLPWELMQDPDRPTPLALDPGFSLIDRTLKAEGKASEVPAGESLRVLMVIARPMGLLDVSYQMVARPLLERLALVRGQVALEVLRPPTLDALKARLEAAASAGRPYHVLHFDGHGVLQRGASGGGGGGGSSGGGFPRDRYQAGGEGFVAFEKAAGGDDLVSAATFAQLVRAGRVPVVVLNACQSGAMPEAAEAAVATRLLLEGAASVVAMGYSVYAVAAAEFMAAFYEALFKGGSVSAAVMQGRGRLARQPKRPSPKGPLALADWMVPVHYQRRAVAFPQLKPAPRHPLALDAALDALRAPAQAQAPAPAGAAVHAEGSIEPVGRFVGRDAFIYTLEIDGRHARVVLVHGPGGTGKTELAKAFARWWRDSGGLDSLEWVFFHSFEPGLPSFGLDGVVNALGLRLFGPDFVGRTQAPEQRRALLLQALRQHRMLLIWDNFESVYSMPDPTGATPALDAGQRGEITRFLEAFRGAGFQSALILTSRSEEDWLGDVRRVPLGGLSPQEAAEYADDLLAPYPKAQVRRRQEKAFADLMDWLAGHPLSLRLILPLLEGLGAADLLQGLRGQGALPQGFAAAAGRLESLGACVKYSFDHLDAGIRRLLPALSLFEGVVLEPALGMLSQQPGVPARFAEVAKEKWQAALQASARVGLLTPLPLGQFGLHPALPAYLSAQWQADAGEGFAEEREAAERALLAAYADFGTWLYQQIEGGSAEAARALIESQRRSMGRLVAFALDQKRYDLAQDILQPLDTFWDARGLREEAKGWVARIRAAVEGPGGAAPDFDTDAGALWLFAVGSDANRARTAGDLQGAEAAYDAIRQALEAAPQGEKRDRRLAVAYHELGNVAFLRGDLDGASIWYRKSLTIEEALNNRPGMASSYHQLGTVAQDGGDLDGAATWYRKSLAIKESLNDRPGMATTYHQLGRVAQDRGDLDGASTWYRKSLTISESLNNRPGMAKTYHQLGILTQDGGDLDGGATWYRKALDLAEALRNRPYQAAILHQLGILAQDGGDLDGASTWYQKSLAISEALNNRPGMALTYAQLGLLAERRGDAAGALDWAVRCVALFEAFPHPSTGTGPPDVARSTRALGFAALASSWQRTTGKPLPAHVKDGVARMIEALPPLPEGSAADRP